MADVGFRIQQEMVRPDKEILELFRKIPVANIADCMNRMACLDSGMQPYNNAPLLGPAFTVRAPAGDNLMMHKALDMAQPGDIIVVASDSTTQRAYCGEIMLRYAESRGIGGFVIDGSIRDRAAIAASAFPVYARGVTPNGPYKNGPGEIGFPVAIGGQVICPGDILVGDADGIVVIRPSDAREIAAAAKAVLEQEEHTLKDISTFNREWIDKALCAKGL